MRSKNLIVFFLKASVFLCICHTSVAKAADARLVNETQANMSNAMVDVCLDTRNASTGLINRCDQLLKEIDNDADRMRVNVGEDASNNPVYDAITQIAPEQAIVPSIQAARTMRGMLGASNAAVISRMTQLRAQMRDPNAVHFAQRVQQNPGSFSFALSPSQSGGSAGIADSNRLGIWGNGNYTAGNVDTSTNQQGFNFGNWGGDLGVDYRINNNIVVGSAFSYTGTNANVNDSRSTVKSDSYTGSIFSMYTHNSGLYIDGIASYGGINYQLNRDIVYTLGTTGAVVDNIPSIAGRPDGSQYSFAGGIGYQYNRGATTVEPFARANYQELMIDSYKESNVAAWAMGFSKQNISSLPTTLGLRLNHAFSTSRGIFQPQVLGAWNHEFSDNQHSIDVRYLNSNNINNNFHVLAQNPDRDYFTVGASLIGTLPHNVSVFVSYNTILGYQDLSSHRVTFGGRINF
ncbi:outer membrane autotransporter protein [Nitrosomonas sp. Nm84]|uniref:autotransporter outer membrane beta-barrel domain-containing protein n=1 Tax=Nitrosomonas sp. Nm84 TaxID=200124 RepID=UPI000D758596|nr:autotransporter outer membrane beta-barrel domain-containing protein [Nitrosomonas sp. Nm84]PXW86106.1 outer membrane autotransporter protein [Nitrosomonas sp. Nm84]